MTEPARFFMRDRFHRTGRRISGRISADAPGRRAASRTCRSDRPARRIPGRTCRWPSRRRHISSLPPGGADGFRVALRDGKKLPGLQKRAADFIVDASFCAQNFLFAGCLLYVPAVLPEPAVHGLQAQIVLFQLLPETRFLGDVHAGDLVDDSPGHLHLPSLKAPCLPV